MANATATKVVPLISSDTAGPLGAIHLPRLWAKLTLHNAGMLPESYDSCGKGFDQMTITNLGLDREQVLSYIAKEKPTYVQFEQWVRGHGKTDPETIRKHNEAVRGYHHSDSTREEICRQTGLQGSEVRDAVRLNMLDDLHDLHAMAVGRA